jgi:predicted short-subunit dehydrogenase-like oxidoreductase (DUF2520 family)
MPRHPKVSIVGAGTVGSTLAVALSEKGYPILSVISRTGRRAISLAKAVNCARASTQIGDIDPETQLLLITVSDGAIAGIAENAGALKTLKFKKLFAAHCSGVHTAGVLDPLKRKGALTGSLHPIQTFPSGQSPARLRAKLRGIYYGLEGEPEAIARAEQIVRDLEGKSIIIPEEMKPLYHVACVFASNYLVVFLNTISELSRTIHLKASWTEVFGPLMTTTMEYTVKQSAAASLTGPIVRGDSSTVDAHLRALAEHAPQFLPLYTIAGIEAARVAKQQGRMSQEEFNAMVARLKQFIQTQTPDGSSNPQDILKVKRN